MYVRLRLRNDGALFLEQFLTFTEPSVNGKPSQEVSRWEAVPTVGRTDAEARSLPLGMTCGIFLVEAVETIFSSVLEGRKESPCTYSVSALDIYKITQKDNSVEIFTKDRVSFQIKMEYFEFLNLLTGLMNKFEIYKIDLKGQITKEKV